MADIMFVNIVNTLKDLLKKEFTILFIKLLLLQQSLKKSLTLEVLLYKVDVFSIFICLN